MEIVRSICVGILFGAFAGWAAVAGSARAAAGDEACEVPDSLTYVDFRLPRVAAAIGAKGPLRIVVIGTASSMGAGVSEPAKAYPLQLTDEIGRRFPSVRLSLVNASRRGDTAAMMADRFGRDVIAEAPHLVVWQTGSVDAMRGVDADAFADTLVRGIERLRAQEIDAILMDDQYNPAAESVLRREHYRQRMQWLAQAYDVPLFRRHDIMLYWDQNDVIDLSAGTATEQRRNADLVNRCIAVLLANMIESAVKAEPGPAPKP